MERQVFLEKNRSVNSVNTKKVLDISIENKERLLPINKVEENLSLLSLYNREKDECNDYKMVFTVNTICSNVLFNNFTEIVKKEGSDSTIVIDNTSEESIKDVINTTAVNNEQAIRDTEYSRKDVGYKYLPGIDIFNNHILRSTDFLHVQQAQDGANNAVYNTIYDYQVDNQRMPMKNSTGNYLRLYNHDNILSMKEAFREGLKEKDGWYGFYNKGYIDIANGKVSGTTSAGTPWEKETLNNRVLNDRNQCSFIDMYPDRTLFSFVPKINKYQHRAEKNWDYCITYPYACDYDKFNEINNDGDSDGIFIIRQEVTHNTNGMVIVRFKTLLNHNLKANDYVRFYYQKNGQTERYAKSVRVYDTGYNNADYNRYFSVRLLDINALVEKNGEEYVFPGKIWFRKENNGSECNYYFRKFKKITVENRLPNSEVNRLGFAANIYGDEMAQVIFLEPVNIEGLTDNLGKPLSELYFTVIKTNRGHEKWYADTGRVTTGTSIEYSHCFGKITSGIEIDFDDDDMNAYSGLSDYNVYKMHNVDLSKYQENDATKEVYATLSNMPKVLEDDITLSGFSEFYADIVEYDLANEEETVIQKVFHRFNTEQRETMCSEYSVKRNIVEDDIFTDGDDINETGGTVGFSGTTNIVNSIGGVRFAGNINPEGYYYYPHYPIKIKEVSDTLESVSVEIVNYDYTKCTYSTTDEALTVKIVPPTTQKFIIGDTFAYYNIDSQEIKWGTLMRIDDDGNLEIVLNDYDVEETEADFRNGKELMLKTKDGCPYYATFDIKSMKMVWRPVLNYSSLSPEDSLYNIPFANGLLYIHENINIYLKRQDPEGKYGLLSPPNSKGFNPLKSYNREGWPKLQLSVTDYALNTIRYSCE